MDFLKIFSIEDADKRMDSIVKSVLQDTIPYNELIQNKRDWTYLLNKGSVVCVHLAFKTLQTDDEKLLKSYCICNNEIRAVFVDNRNFVDFIALGDDFIGIFDTPLCSDIDRLLETIGKLNAVLYCIKEKINMTLHLKLDFQIGVDYTKLMMINNVENGLDNSFSSPRTWNGIALIKAKELSVSNFEVLPSEKHVYISARIYNNIKEEYKKFFSSSCNDYYIADIVNTNIINWLKSHKS